ncbi:exosome non-catalytic core subunit rrp46 [Arachnomyces sp. PD_36]|nr:exosome non-catalytic core subunit rrp46 [Arachnomyces sp. PD_36]
MTATTALNNLHRPDGSATYTSPTTGHRVVCSVNGPLEVGRRDAQKPEEATIDVLVRHGTGATGVGERYVEGIVRDLISRVILGREKGMPRKGVVVTLAVSGGKDGRGGRGEDVIAGRGGSYLPVLPALLNATLLGLLTASIPLSMTYTAAIIAVSSGKILHEPSITDISTASSLHVLAISSNGHILLNESEGEFDLETWETVVDRAHAICQGGEDTSLGEKDVNMDESSEDGQDGLEGFVREVVGNKIQHDHAWSIAT